ncbi:endonuclease/exonuclease/phosphatase family protein [Salinimicrobium sp. MT39]|uniref:Endonuclease/exonuclease/phosphatase family protein n=1 Tax=Salinimicrobium profundisediminis TaxID=2994553 RepID=A0A9X3I0M1_9FLAO|nr:endonuclease/exonuclease/phosphatase family protein [Salinimicrobium profundisediminis]MCX2837694.1 endonuclease/exonuclease/phosphatase family protein [Salinimicrobium profundisediminis]
MNIAEVTAYILSFIILFPTAASISRFDQWWIRDFDFPRLQISVLILAVMIYNAVAFDFSSIWETIITVVVGLSFIYQATKIYPYTYLASKQVKVYRGKEVERQVSILVSNVLTTNTKYDKLVKLIIRENPDLVLTLESDETWEKELSRIEEEYSYTVKIPLKNLYGMHLYSKLELEDIHVKYIISEEIPSIHGKVKLRSGEKVNIHCLHPKPPSPSEDDTSTNRDAELLLVGREIDGKNATLVFGDLNDVAWSRTTKLFLRLSGLLDPRIGRGFYNTFHAQYPVFRWPLDHVFHSSDFLLLSLKRLEKMGSDHFPMFIKLVYQPENVEKNGNGETEEPDEEEKEWAEEKIDKGQHPESHQS